MRITVVREKKSRKLPEPVKMYLYGPTAEKWLVELRTYDDLLLLSRLLYQDPGVNISHLAEENTLGKAIYNAVKASYIPLTPRYFYGVLTGDIVEVHYDKDGRITQISTAIAGARYCIEFGTCTSSKLSRYLISKLEFIMEPRD